MGRKTDETDYKYIHRVLEQVEGLLANDRLLEMLRESGDSILTSRSPENPSSNYTQYAFTPEGLYARTVTLNNDGDYLPVAMPDINTEEQVQPYRFMGRRVFKRALAVTDLVALMSGGGIDIMTKLGFSSPICLIGVRGYVIDEHGIVPIPQYGDGMGSIYPSWTLYMSDVSGGYSKHLQLVIQYSNPTGGFVVLEYTKQFDGGDYYGSGSGGGEPESPYPIIEGADWNESRMFKSPYTLQELSNGFEVYSAQGNWIRFTYQGDGIFQGDISVESIYPDSVTVAFAGDGEINWLEAVDDYDHWFFNGHGLISPFPIRLVQ